MNVPITTSGADKLREELHELKTVVRPRIIQAIADARAHGDLKENAEYHAAREQQSFTEGRIQKLESVLSDAKIIDVTKLKSEGRVVFGATVALVNEDNGNEVTYQIVGDVESDIKQHKVSISSPIARAMIGKEEGDIATVNAPGGITEYEITRVRYI